MLLYLFLLIAGFSTAELYVLVQVGSAIGAFPAIALTVLTAAVGASLVRSQGLQTAFEAQRKMNQGETPAIEMISGLLLLVAGVFLVMPGFISDLIGMLILLPPLRNLLANKIMNSRGIKLQMPGGFPPNRNNPDDQHHGTTIDGEYERRDNDQLK